MTANSTRLGPGSVVVMWPTTSQCATVAEICLTESITASAGVIVRMLSRLQVPCASNAPQGAVPQNISAKPESAMRFISFPLHMDSSHNDARRSNIDQTTMLCVYIAFQMRGDARGRKIGSGLLVAVSLGHFDI